MIVLLFLSGILLSATAAYYSIIGLVAIFPGTTTAIITMGGSLEFAKLIGVSWLYRSWHFAPRFIKYYMSAAVLILMIITSMGIFGFLSKSHLEHATPSTNIAAQVKLIDDKINLRKENIETEKKNIEVAREAIAQLDSQVTARMGIMSSSDAAQAISVRKQQKGEREALNKEISASQDKIEKYNNEVTALTEQKMPIETELRKIEVEVGPLKYIAELIYGTDAESHFDQAVRFVIILLVLVFDPLAIFLLLAANASVIHYNSLNKKVEKSEENEYDNDSNTYNFIMGEDHNVKHVDEYEVDKNNVWVPSVLRKRD